jgi:hypothetical protein
MDMEFRGKRFYEPLKYEDRGLKMEDSGERGGDMQLCLKSNLRQIPHVLYCHHAAAHRAALLFPGLFTAGFDGGGCGEVGGEIVGGEGLHLQ